MQSRVWLWLIVALIVLLLLGGVVVVTNETVVKKIARAIAKAEGFYVAGSRPQRNHNPGNMTRDITGKSIGNDQGPGVSYVLYQTDADGWEALEKQVRLMFTGSRIYNPMMSIQEVANKYTATQQMEWARNVSGALGVTPATKLNEIA
jgi:hypothetical protein